MAKQIFIDSNGNEIPVSGTITNDNNLPHYTGTPTAGSTAEAIASKVNTSDIETTLDTSSPNPIANSAVATAINGIGFKKASISAGNKALTDLQAFCKTGEKGLLWAMPYVTTPSTGWAFVIFANKLVSDSHAEIYIFFNDKITSSYTSNLSATTPSWTTKNVTLT